MGSLCAVETSRGGPLPALVEGALELVETTEPEAEFMRLGFKSGVPLAYMNLLAMGSGEEAARTGERGAETTLGVEVVAGKLMPFA